MKHGPQFLRDSLHKVAGADSYVTPYRTPSEPTKRLSVCSTLLHAWYHQELRGVLDDSELIIAKETLDDPREFYRRTITSHLWEVCADRIGCKQCEVVSWILDMIEMPGHRLAWLCRPDRVRLVLGLPLDGKGRERKVIEDVRALAIRD